MSHSVTLEPFGIEFECGEDETVLEAAFKAGISLRYGCKHGGCGACKATIADGDVDYDDHATAISEEEMDAGIALLCCAFPEEDIVIELDDDYSEEELTPEFPVRIFDASVESVKFVTHDTAHLTLHGKAGDRFDFRPGQFLEIQVPGQEDLWRCYSMANVPNDEGRTELVVKIIPDGQFSSYLQNAKAGDDLQFRGPFGQFYLSDTDAEIIMVAGGSGMAPIVSMLQQLVDESSKRKISFYFGARTDRDLYFLEEIAALGDKLANFQFIPALSEVADDDKWDGETGMITDVLRRHTDNLRGAEGYLCGPPPMIDAAVEVLREKGMFASRIRFDKFVDNS